ncbi:hypothetical protein HK405_014719 [Cladochytrium tenue]|nr:hypothetical protein HK405_014719 [Cladochytrium tenue]
MALSLRYAMVLTTRRLSRTDRLAGATLGLWWLYVLVQVTDYWTKRVSGAIPNWAWVTATMTLCYSFALCAITYIAGLRIIALTSPTYSEALRLRLEKYALYFGVVIFLARAVRTVFVFLNTQMNLPINGLSSVTNTMQSVTILLCFVPCLVMDGCSIFILYTSRAKIIEVLLCLLALVQTFQEAVNPNTSTYNEFAFADWLFISWCIASWVEQRKLFQSIFGDLSSAPSDPSAATGVVSSRAGAGSNGAFEMQTASDYLQQQQQLQLQQMQMQSLQQQQLSKLPPTVFGAPTQFTPALAVNSGPGFAGQVPPGAYSANPAASMYSSGYGNNNYGNNYGNGLGLNQASPQAAPYMGQVQNNGPVSRGF